MASKKPAAFLAGLGLLLRHMSLLGWIYLVNLLLALIATGGFARRAGGILNHSLAADRLVHGFDIGTLASLIYKPESPLNGSVSALLGSSFLFTVFLLFVTGGLLVTYYNDRPLSIGPFFEACGHYFWRLVRLMILFAFLLIPIGMLGGTAAALFRRVDARSVSPFPAIHFLEATLVVIVFLLMCVRLWFDMAQVIAVADDEPRIRKALKRAASLLRHNFVPLFWLYLRISLVGWIGFGAALHVWIYHLPPGSIKPAILLAQTSIIVWLATRLWQRASEAAWYRRYSEAANVSSPSLAADPSPVAPYAPAIR